MTVTTLLRSARRFARRRARSRRVAQPICDDLKAWALADDDAGYEVIDAAFTTSRPVPKTVEPHVHPSFLPLTSFPVPERALVRVPNARIRGEFGLVILPSGEFVGELVALTPEGRRTMLHNEPSYYEPLPRTAMTKHGNFYPVLGMGVQHYYHWSHDVIMRMRGIGERLPPDTQLIVPERMHPFQIETLGLLGLDDHPRVHFPAGPGVWELENLYVVTPIQKTQIDHPAPYRWFREATFQRYGLRERKGTRKLYLSRHLDNHWRVTNELEVQALLTQYGFETVTPATLSFREQAELFGQANVIVGTGAGLMNMVFSPPGTTVIQFQDPEHFVHALWTMAGAVDFEYHYVLCDPVRNPAGANADLFVPTEKLEATLAACRVGKLR